MKKICKCYTELKFKAGQFIKFIGQHSIYGKISYITDYMIKVQIIKYHESYGYFVIYYKPTKKQYSTSVKEIRNPDMQEYLLELWDGMNREIIREEAHSGKYYIWISLPT